MPNLYKRGAVWWLAFKVQGRLFRRSLGTRDAATARRLASDIGYELTKRRILADLGLDSASFNSSQATLTVGGSVKSRLLQEAQAMQPSEAWERYEAWASVNKQSRTLEREDCAWRAFTEYTRNKPPSLVTVQDIEAFKAYSLKAGKQPATVNTDLAKVSAVYGRLVVLDLLAANPFTKVPHLRLDRKPPKFLSQVQLDSLLEAARTERQDVYLFVALCALAGLRHAEALACMWTWIDLNAKTITIQPGPGFQPKDHDSRTVPISERLHGILARFESSGYVIAPEKSRGKWRNRVELRKPFEAVCKAAGVEWCTAHVLRHTFASVLVQSGVSLYKVQSWLGHSDSSTTAIYAHLQAYDADVNGRNAKFRK